MVKQTIASQLSRQRAGCQSMVNIAYACFKTEFHSFWIRNPFFRSTPDGVWLRNTPAFRKNEENNLKFSRCLCLINTRILCLQWNSYDKQSSSFFSQASESFLVRYACALADSILYRYTQQLRLVYREKVQSWPWTILRSAHTYLIQTIDWYSMYKLSVFRQNNLSIMRCTAPSLRPQTLVNGTSNITPNIRGNFI